MLPNGSEASLDSDQLATNQTNNDRKQRARYR